MSYALTAVRPNKQLLSYLTKSTIKAIQFTGSHYTLAGKTVGGLIPALTERFYPDYKQKKRQFRRKGVKRRRKASTKKQGITIDKQLQTYIETPNKRPRNALAKAVVAYLEDECKQRLQAAQVPVVIPFFGSTKVSQADLITEDKEGRLYMVEVKSGYNQSKSQGTLKHIITTGGDDVKSNRKNHWELQRHFTHQGLVSGGLPIEASFVVNVYQEDDKIAVKKRKNPKWIKDQKW